MKTWILAGFGLGLLSLTSQSQAGVTVDLRFGSRDHHSHETVYPGPCPREYPRVVIVQSRDCENFYDTGRAWSRNLRENAVTRDQFVHYLRFSLNRASERDVEEFRRGFTQGYGFRRYRFFEKALRQAREC